MSDNNAEKKLERGEALAIEFSSVADEISKDLVKFFDKGQKAAARRCRKNLSFIGKWGKEVRKEISKINNQREAVKAEAKS